MAAAPQHAMRRDVTSHSLMMRVTEGCEESLYTEMIWACFMQMTNLVHAATHLEYSKFTNIRTELRTNSYAYARVVN